MSLRGRLGGERGLSNPAASLAVCLLGLAQTSECGGYGGGPASLRWGPTSAVLLWLPSWASEWGLCLGIFGGDMPGYMGTAASTTDPVSTASDPAAPSSHSCAQSSPAPHSHISLPAVLHLYQLPSFLCTFALAVPTAWKVPTPRIYTVPILQVSSP